MQGCIYFLHSLLFEKLMGPFSNFSYQAPIFLSFWCCEDFWPDCTSLLDYARGAFFVNLMFWIFGFEVFSPLVHYMLYCALFLSTLYSGPYDFSLYFWEIFAYLWPFCPILHGFLCYEFHLWVQLGCSSTKVHGGFFTTICFGTLFWTYIPSFPSQAVGCFFIKHCSWTPLTVGPKIFSIFFGKNFACLWPFSDPIS